MVECHFPAPPGAMSLALHDSDGNEIPYEVLERQAQQEQDKSIVFIAREVPSVGYKTYYVASSSTPPAAPTPLTGDTVENKFYRLTFGPGGIKSLYDKRLNWEVLRTSKFDAAEVDQFTAPGQAWEDSEIVTTEDFDKTSNHPFPFKQFSKTALRTTAIREAQFKHFVLRESFHLYDQLDRVDMEIEILNWDGTNGNCGSYSPSISIRRDCPTRYPSVP